MRKQSRKNQRNNVPHINSNFTKASVDAKQAAIAAAIADLQAQIAAGSGATAEQLQGVVDKLSATQADVDSTPTA